MTQYSKSVKYPVICQINFYWYILFVSLSEPFHCGKRCSTAFVLHPLMVFVNMRHQYFICLPDLVSTTLFPGGRINQKFCQMLQLGKCDVLKPERLDSGKIFGSVAVRPSFIPECSTWNLKKSLRVTLCETVIINIKRQISLMKEVITRDDISHRCVSLCVCGMCVSACASLNACQRTRALHPHHLITWYKYAHI